ncbi:MAG: histidine--tRNA ligase [Gammaproteobacteria bacterium]|nr:histidine--tRNA ligase [Gammaproteobacteria bacterium]
MTQALRPVRGFNDILPPASVHWQRLENEAAAVLEQAGYGEIRLPVVESTDLFARSIGASSDIVEKEMYSFPDRQGHSLSLRPEATAGCVRAGITQGLFDGGQLRLWYRGPMFRHERPQKGRYRQFHQIGAEAFGMTGAGIEAELIALAARLWKRIGLNGVTLKINTLGSFEDRKRYRAALLDFLHRHEDSLDDDSRRRLGSNPLRILDSKVAATRELLENAPRIVDSLGSASAAHFDELRRQLDALGIAYVCDPFLVRGLDYYTGSVFEWVTDALGAQDAICSGGRYDGLVEELGGRRTPAAGWALGMERLVLLAESQAVFPAPSGPDAYLVALGEAPELRALALAEALRDRLPRLRLIVNADGGSLKAQMRRADKCGARFAIILGESELANGAVTVKPLLEKQEQLAVAQDVLADFLAQRIQAA